MGQTISGINRPPTMSVSKEHYDNLLHKYQRQEDNLKIFEKSNIDLKNIIGERNNTIKTLKREIETNTCELQLKDAENKDLKEEKKSSNNKINLGQKCYDDLKKEFDIASNALADKDDVIYKKNCTIEEYDKNIKTLNRELSIYKKEDKQQDLEITSLKDKNSELRKQAIATQEELSKIKQQFTLINNIVDEVID